MLFGSAAIQVAHIALLVQGPGPAERGEAWLPG